VKQAFDSKQHAAR